jgi:hypothetical protein
MDDFPATPVDAGAVARFAAAIFDGAPRGLFAEVRFKREDGMGRSFHRVSALDDLVSEVIEHARRCDVFVGVIPRRWRRGGRRDLAEEGVVVWADCDGAGSVAALRRFEPAPSMVVASGSGSNCHAYWLLERPAPLDVVEQTNRRLAIALHADPRSCDAARILRPAGTANWKSNPPAAVRLLALDRGARVDIADLARSLPEFQRRDLRAQSRQPRAAADEPDRLLEIAPRDYIEQLSGRTVGRERKVQCPFHDDRSPSLHVFDEPERGWFCFGCGSGGSIYDFASLLWGRELRGLEIQRLRTELEATFLSGATRASDRSARRRAFGSPGR